MSIIGGPHVMPGGRDFLRFPRGGVVPAADRSKDCRALSSVVQLWALSRNHSFSEIPHPGLSSPLLLCYTTHPWSNIWFNLEQHRLELPGSTSMQMFPINTATLHIHMFHQPHMKGSIVDARLESVDVESQLYALACAILCKILT